MAVLNEPLSPRVTYHSIIGRAHPTDLLEESSDKAVPYLRAHLEGTKTEKIVHASHTQVTSSPGALDEMRRILYQHIAQTVPAQ